MKTIIVRCIPDHAAVRALIDEEALNGACAWMRVELPALALEELHDLVNYYHHAPQEVMTIAARLSMVVTVFDEDDNPPAQDVIVLDGCSCSLALSRVAPIREPPWVLIAASHVTFCITGADSFDHSELEFDIASVEVPYAALGLMLGEPHELLATR
jgi:hypothetical protein